MSKVIVLANQKGGVGKTTTTANLAYALTRKAQRVLAVDLDPQASVSTTLKTGVGKRRDFTDTSLYQEVSHEQEVYRPTFG